MIEKVKPTCHASEGFALSELPVFCIAAPFHLWPSNIKSILDNKNQLTNVLFLFIFFQKLTFIQRKGFLFSPF